MCIRGLINTYLVWGFYDAGKSTYIKDCLKNDYFYKRGKTLLVLLEDGEEEFDDEFLQSRNTVSVIYPGQGSVKDFLLDRIDMHQPDRIYIECNTMMEGLQESLPDCLKVVFSITIMDGSTLGLYYRNMRQLLVNMITASNQVIFNRCPKREMLDPYANIFRVMNKQAVYLWEGPGGYHEKAFGVMVPYDRESMQLDLKEEDFVPFYLDSLEKPEVYAGKEICALFQMKDENGERRAGRRVMTCCAADIQFLSFPCILPDDESEDLDGWFLLYAKGLIVSDSYGRKRLQLQVERMNPVNPPEHAVIGLS